MKIGRFGSYFFKKFFCKRKVWLILTFSLIAISFFFYQVIKNKGAWFYNVEWKKGPVKISGSVTSSSSIPFHPKISNVNDFFHYVFPNLIFIPALVWTFVASPVSHLFWDEIGEMAQKNQRDGTDLFFLSTEIPTSRKQIFWRKVFFLTSLLVGLHLILFALPLSLVLWKVNHFSNFTGLHTFLFLAWNFLITPLFFFIPLVIFLFSLASLNSAWYTFLKWFGRLSVLLFLGVLNLCSWGGMRVINDGIRDFSFWLDENYLLATLTIMGVVIFLALFTLSLAYKDFQKRDLR